MQQQPQQGQQITNNSTYPFTNGDGNGEENRLHKFHLFYKN
jgi:hypothetical protein